jgi:hypothetical protein
MNRTEFNQEAERLAKFGAPLDDVDVLLQELLKTRAAWSHDALLGLVYGEHGNIVASQAMTCLVHGCKPRTKVPSSNGHKSRGYGDPDYFVFAAEAFAKHCLERGRVELLKTIATRRIPVALFTHQHEKRENVLKRVVWTPRSATTDAGDALDVMSGAENSTREGFVDLLMEMQEQRVATPDVLRQLRSGARLLLELDPDHPDIHRKTNGTPLGALFTEEMMRLRLELAPAATATSNSTVTTELEAPRRRLRHV